MWEVHRIVYEKYGSPTPELEAVNVVSNFVFSRSDRRVPPAPYLRSL